MTKYLFLDIDGVLNSSRTDAAFDGYPHQLTEKDYAKLDPVAIGLINKIAEEGVEIILSSSWRWYFPQEDISKFLGVPLKGSTPLRTFGPRGGEIKEFLDNNPCNQYAIVDDVDEFLTEQRPNLVLTEETEGLSYKDYVRLKEILELDIKVA